MADDAPRAVAEILLATDLSHRCDRAFERALLLSRAQAAHLRIVHILADAARGLAASAAAPDWYRPQAPEQAARARIYADLARADPAVDFAVQIAAGAPADEILAIAGAKSAGLIVIGIASETGWLAGSGTFDRLARKASAPLLMVRDSVTDAYADLLVTTDFSAASRRALQVARALFPAARLTLFHAYDVPYAIYHGRKEIARQFAADRAQQARTFLIDAGLSAAEVEATRRIVEYGSAEALLATYHAEFAHHLTVIGAGGGGRVYEALVGSTGRRLAQAMPGDILFVPAGGAA